MTDASREEKSGRVVIAIISYGATKSSPQLQHGTESHMHMRVGCLLVTN